MDEFQIEEAAGEVETSGVTPFQALVDLGYLDADRITQALCDHLGAVGPLAEDGGIVVHIAICMLFLEDHDLLHFVRKVAVRSPGRKHFLVPPPQELCEVLSGEGCRRSP